MQQSPILATCCFICANSSTTHTLFYCSGCRNVRYCSKECQKKHWPEHKEECKTKKMQGEVTIDETNKRTAIIDSIPTTKLLRYGLHLLIPDTLVVTFFLKMPFECPIQPIEVVCLERAKLPSRLFPPVPVAAYHLIGWNHPTAHRSEVAGLGLEKPI